MSRVETELERQLSTVIMQAGARPRIRKVRAGARLTEQGTPGDELYLVLDGMLVAEVDGEAIVEIGPGAIVGERASLEGGTRTATVRAVTACRIAVADVDQLDRDPSSNCPQATVASSDPRSRRPRSELACHRVRPASVCGTGRRRHFTSTAP